MIQRVAKVGLCIAFATGIAMAMCVVTYFAYWPPRWHFHAPEMAWAIALSGALYFAAAPLLILGLIGLHRAPGAALCASLSTAWLLLLFLIRALRNWTYYGEFPWWMLLRDFVQPLPISLAMGLAFAVSARNVLGSARPIEARG
jgi:hypothetical protein